MSEYEGMRCPKCQSMRLFVIESRPRENSIMRRRGCRACGGTFKTFEYSEADFAEMDRDLRADLKTMQSLGLRVVQRCEEALKGR